MEPIEIALRTRVTLSLTLETRSAFAHEQASLFRPGWDHAAWLRKLNEEASRSKELFVSHHQQTYLGFPSLPMWKAIEVMSFGTLSVMYANLRKQQQARVARQFQLHPRYLASWFHTLTVLRNACAHHARCWDARRGVKPSLPQEAKWDGFRHTRDELGCTLLLVHQLLGAVNPQTATEWGKSARELVAPLAPTWSSRMGLPTDFLAHPLWTL
jgi:abortive infection bacteriophage resistance protein